MQQMMPDIDPWKFRTFHPAECPAKVLEKLPFGECIHAYCIENTYSTNRNTFCKPFDYNIAKDIMDRAYATNKEKLYPELLCNRIRIVNSEIIKNNSSSRYNAVMSIVSIPEGIINIHDSEESIRYWHDEFTPMYHERVMDVCQSSQLRESSEPFFPSLIIPKVYYDIDNDLIYNRLIPLKSGDYCIIPMYVSSVGGAIVVKAIDDCTVPLGTGRCRTLGQAVEAERQSNESRALRVYHTHAVENAYRDYTYAEFNDKSVLLNKLAELPVEIVKEMYTIRI
jgi:hypothetical protein